jgi:hypothetical protein
MGDSAFTGLIRVGKVEAVNGTKVRVFYEDTGNHTGWISVLQRSGGTVTVETADGHTHKATTATWVPVVNQYVLVAYLPLRNSDGYVIGGL